MLVIINDLFMSEENLSDINLENGEAESILCNSASVNKKKTTERHNLHFVVSNSFLEPV